MTMAPGIEAAASPHGRAAAAAAAAAAAWYQQGASAASVASYPETSPASQMHHSSVQGVVDHPATAAGHPAAHGSAHEASFFGSDAASRYYQMHYENAATQGKT